MTNFTELTDSQLQDAINHHRRLRNQAAGGVSHVVCEHNRKQVLLGEAEATKRLLEQVAHRDLPNGKGVRFTDNTGSNVKMKRKDDKILVQHTMTSSGVKIPETNFMERAEPLDEISKKTLQSYVAKGNTRTMNDLAKMMHNGDNDGTKLAKLTRRFNLVDKAANKANMKKEDTQLDEISKDKGCAYRKASRKSEADHIKIATDLDNKAEDGRRSERTWRGLIDKAAEHEHVYYNRREGQNLASRKLYGRAKINATEEVEPLDEINVMDRTSTVKRRSLVPKIYKYGPGYHVVTKQGEHLGTYKSMNDAMNNADGPNKLVYKEDVQLDELSKSTLLSYQRKAFTDPTRQDGKKAAQAKLTGWSKIGYQKEEKLNESAAETHINGLKAKFNCSPTHKSTYRSGVVIDNAYQVYTDANPQDIFDHLKSKGFEKTKGSDSNNTTWSGRKNPDDMAWSTDSVHHKDGVAISLRKEHGGRLQVRVQGQ